MLREFNLVGCSYIDIIDLEIEIMYEMYTRRAGTAQERLNS
jgi:hypothetical protein